MRVIFSAALAASLSLAPVTALANVPTGAGQGSTQQNDNGAHSTTQSHFRCSEIGGVMRAILTGNFPWLYCRWL